MKQKYILDTETLEYKIHRISIKQKLLKLTTIFAVCFVISIIFFYTVDLTHFTTSGLFQQKQNNNITGKFVLLDKKLQEQSKIIASIEENDDIV